jgi:hypothetical protein
MGHLIQWDNAEQTVVLQQYTGDPVKDDLYHLAEESAAMLKTVPHKVHLIVDERTIKLTLNSMDIKYLEKHVPTNQGVVIVVIGKSGTSYKKLIQNIGKALAPKAFKQTFFATTVEEARQLLREQFRVNYPQSALTGFG